MQERKVCELVNENLPSNTFHREQQVTVVGFMGNLEKDSTCHSFSKVQV